MSTHDKSAHKNSPIAIVGMGCIFPKAQGNKDYWRLLFRGTDCIEEIPKTHWSPDDYFDKDPKAPDMTYCRRGGFLSTVAFDPTEFGIPPMALEATDTSQLLSLVVAKMAMQDAGYGEGGKAYDKEKVSVILGATGTQELVINLGARLGHPIWRKALLDSGLSPEETEEIVAKISDGYVPWQENSFPGLLGNVISGRIASRLDFGGTNCAIDAACASSLSAMHLGLLELQAGEAEMVLTGGSDALNDIFMYMCFSKTPALSPTGDLRPFSSNADGTTLGEGIGIVALKRLEDAERDQDDIYAVIQAMGSSSDGRSQSIYAPRAAGQQKAIRRAYQKAGVTPEQISLIEAHGTGTKVGDAVEFDSLKDVFGETEKEGRWCAIGSVKSQIGHTKSAAGAASVIKAALALYHKVLPPTLKVEQPNPKLDIENTPFYLNTEARPWFHQEDAPRRAGVSSFGFGGSNFHVLLEEYQAQKPKAAWNGGVEIVPFSADTREALRKDLSLWAQTYKERKPSVKLAHLAHQARLAFDGNQQQRLLFVFDIEDDIAAHIAQAHAMLEQKVPKSNERLRIFYGEGQPEGKLAFLFPGQGSQYVNMGREWLCLFPESFDTFCRADDDEFGEIRLTEKVFPIPVFSDDERNEQQRELSKTEVAQPAIGAVSLAMSKVLERFGVTPDAVAGHSYGELVALHVAGVIDEKTFHQLSRKRGELMANDGKDRGTMMAVKAPLEEIDAWLAEAKLDVILANRNHPTQGVLSGSKEGIAKAEVLCKEKGWTARQLTVSAAFHSELVADAAKPFSTYLKKLKCKKPTIPVFSNVTGGAYPDKVSEVKKLLSKQLTSPVDFVGEVQGLYALGCRTFVEVGPKSVLGRLVPKCLPGQEHQVMSVDVHAGRKSALLGLGATLAQLAAVGFPVALHEWEDEPVKTREHKMVVPLTGANIRKTFHTEFGRQLANKTWTPPVKAPKAPVAAVRQTQPKQVAVHPQPQSIRPQSQARKTTTPHMQQTSQSVSQPAKQTPQRIPSTQPVHRSPSQIHHNRSQRMADYNQANQSASTPYSPQQSVQHPPQPPVQADGSFWMGAFQVVQEGLRSMQALQTQTALNHQRFLEVQDNAQRALHGMMASSQQLVQAASAGAPVAQQTVSLQPLTPVQLPQPQWTPQAGPAQTFLEPPRQAPVYQQPAPQAPVYQQSPAPAHRAPVLAQAPLNGTHTPQNGMSARQVTPQAAPQPKVQPAPKPVAAAPVVAAKPASSGAFKGKATDIILEVVAELTGYPQEMLSLEMDMEADLGIDSIKRVEILSTVSERLPEASSVDPEHMGSLRTLDQIVDHLVSVSGVTESAAASTPVQSAPATSGGGADVVDALMSVVSDLTGYPQEMLSLEMDMEADLGIDSIKRVEILSAVTEKLPALANAETESMRNLRTLQEIVDAMGSTGGDAVPFVQAPLPISDQGRGDNAFISFTTQPVTAEDMPARRVLRSVVWDAEVKSTLQVSGRVVVTQEQSEWSQQVASAFSERGYDVDLIEWSQLQEALSKPCVGLCLLTPVNASDEQWDAQVSQLKEAFVAAKFALPSLIDAGSGKSFFATCTRMDGQFGLVNVGDAAVQGGLAGLSKTMARETEDVLCHAFDIAKGETPDAKVFVDCCLDASAPMEIGFAEGKIWQIVLEQTTPVSGAASLQEGDVVVFTGGARGVTAHVAAAMASSLRTPLVLLGRSPLPGPEAPELSSLREDKDLKKALMTHGFQGKKLKTPKELERAFKQVVKEREIRENIAMMRSTGVTVQYHSVDVRDEKALAAVFTTVRQELGPIRGLVHAAGVLEDRFIVDKTLDQFSFVFDTKVEGARALLDATREDELRALIMFSSVSGRAGNRGQVDYAMANEVLNKLAQREQLRREQCHVVSVNWGPWDGGMVTPALKRMFLSQGVQLISLRGGAWSLIEELQKGNEEVEIVVGDIFDEGAAIEAASKKTTKSTGPAYTLSFTRDVSLASYPVLGDHRLKGEPVVPLALLLEWFAHGALHGNPGLKIYGYEGVRVLKGFRLHDKEVRTLYVKTTKASAEDKLFRVSLEIRSAGQGEAEILHARGDALLCNRSTRFERPQLTEKTFGKPSKVTLQNSYEEVLFHGEALRGIEKIEGIDASGMQAVVRTGPTPTSWIAEPLRRRWTHDPMVIDCAFQMAILWCFEQKGLRSLPSFLGTYKQFVKFKKGPMHVRLDVTSTSAHKMKGNFYFIGADGEVVAMIEGYECTMDAALQQAFAQPARGELSA